MKKIRTFKQLQKAQNKLNKEFEARQAICKHNDGFSNIYDNERNAYSFCNGCGISRSKLSDD